MRFRRHLLWALIWRVCVWAEVLCTRLCGSRVMTGQRRSNDRDFTISCHNTNQTHPGLVSVLLPLLKKGLFTQGSDYNVPLTHYPLGVSHSVPLFGAYFLSVLSPLTQNKLLRLNSDHTDLGLRIRRCFKLNCTLGAHDSVDMTSSQGCKGETHVLLELHDWSKLTVQLQLEGDVWVVVCVLLCCWGTAQRNVHKFITSSS